MDIQKNVEGEKLTIAVNGRLDTLSAPQLEAELKLDGVTELIFDLSGLEYTSSAGLRVLLSAQKTMNRQGRMVVRGVQPAVKEVFDITGFSDIFAFEA